MTTSLAIRSLPDTPLITAPRCYILELPAELRVMIAENYMQSIRIPEWRNARHNKKAGPIANRIPYGPPGLLQTCKTLRYDSWDIYVERLREQENRVQRKLGWTTSTRPHRMTFEKMKMQLVATKNEITRAEKERARISA